MKIFVLFAYVGAVLCVSMGVLVGARILCFRKKQRILNSYEGGVKPFGGARRRYTVHNAYEFILMMVFVSMVILLLPWGLAVVGSNTSTEKIAFFLILILTTVVAYIFAIWGIQTFKNGSNK
ncbi:MAG: NADH-quinone oxidoreductase subunit A [Bacteriovoracaceae bacterium]|nr:NADH-quinone oxidoreductase subunit A [Bacteriovoracaceae bacterium]